MAANFISGGAVMKSLSLSKGRKQPRWMGCNENVCAFPPHLGRFQSVIGRRSPGFKFVTIVHAGFSVKR
jgi:hypothetical protein